MGFLFALLAILGESAAKTIDKLNFRKNHIAARQLMLLVFIGMTASLLAYIVLSRQPIPHLSLLSFSLLSLVALVSFAGNVFDYLSLKVNDLSLREPMLNFQPALAGFVGYLLFPAERKPVALVAFIAAIFVVSWGTRRRKLHQIEKSGMFWLLLAVVMYSVLPSLYKVTLEHISPAYIAFFRTAVILILSIIFFKAGKLAYTAKRVQYGLASGAIYAAETVFSLYAIHKLGVVLTMLLTLLGPALMYLSSYFILNEKVRKGEVISSGLLAAIVLVALFA